MKNQFWRQCYESKGVHFAHCAFLGSKLLTLRQVAPGTAILSWTQTISATRKELKIMLIVNRRSAKASQEYLSIDVEIAGTLLISVDRVDQRIM